MNPIRKGLTVAVIILFIGMSVPSTGNNNWTLSNCFLSNNPPYVPSNPKPSGPNISVCPPNLSWTGGDPDGDNVTYDVYFGKDFPPELIAEDIDTTWYQTLFLLEFSTMYYWTIVAEDEHGLTTHGPNWTFTTEENLPPYTPSNPIPPNEILYVPVNTNLSWEGGDPNLGDKVWYEIYLEENDPVDPKYLTTIGSFAASKTDITYDMEEDLELFVNYNWKIVARDSQDLKTESPVWSFDTGPPFLPIVSITGPTKVIKNEITEYIFTLTNDYENNVWFYVDWDDDTNTGWMGPYPTPNEIILNHSWSKRGCYIITAEIKDPYSNGKGDELSIQVPLIRILDYNIIHFLKGIYILLLNWIDFYGD